MAEMFVTSRGDALWLDVGLLNAAFHISRNLRNSEAERGVLLLSADDLRGAAERMTAAADKIDETLKRCATAGTVAVASVRQAF